MRTVYTVEEMAKINEQTTGHIIVARRVDTSTNTEVSNKVVARYGPEVTRAEADRQATDMQANYDRVRGYATASLAHPDERPASDFR